MSVSLEQATSALSFFNEAMSSGFSIHLVGKHRLGHANANDLQFVLVYPIGINQLEGPIALEKDGHLRRRSRQEAGFAKDIQQRMILALEADGLAKLNTTQKNWWGGICRIPNSTESVQDRRQGLADKTGSFVSVQIRCIPEQAAGAALVYWTGDNAFLERMRQNAERQGMRLCEHGLYTRYVWSDHGQGMQDDLDEEDLWTLLYTPTEQAVFQEIGEPFIEPEKRNFIRIVPRVKPGQTPKGASN